jgi:glycosyltransferase involved in cell wall biosynthesis
MRILFLSQLVPYPLDAGPKVRSYHVLRRLAALGHEVTLLAFRRDSDTPAALEQVEAVCERVHTVPIRRSRGRDAFHFGRSLLRQQPFLIARDHDAAMVAAVRDWGARGAFDAIHADQLWMAPYALEAAAAAPSVPHRVLDQHNAVFMVPARLAETSSGARAAVLRREATRLAAYEGDMCRRFDDVVWVTAEDKAAVGLARGPRQTVIPICVDPEAEPPLRRVPRPRRVTFLGGLHWPPNAAGVLWFARAVWPAVRRAYPDARLTIIGRSPPPEVEALPGVEVTGYLADPRPLLQETAAFIVPLHAGGGMRVKILDAWAWGVPVVSTTVGAEGLDAQDGRDLLLADEPDTFAGAVGRLLADEGLGEALAAGGRRTVRQRYAVQTTYAAWAAIYPPASAEAPSPSAEPHGHDAVLV